MGLVVVVLGSPEGEPKFVSRAFMPLHSLLLDGSYPDSAACPTSCRPHDAAARQPASTRTSHPGRLPRPGFVVVPHAGYVPADYSFADTASARAETGSSTGSLRSPGAPTQPHPPASSPSASLPPARPSAAPPRGLPARGWPSASPLLPSPCSWVPPSIRCDKNAPRSAATTLPGKTPPSSPPTPGTYRKRTVEHQPARALSSAVEKPSSWPCLPWPLPLLPALRESLPHSRRSPLAATHSAPRRPNSASAIAHRGIRTDSGPLAACCARPRSARRSSGSARLPCSGSPACPTGLR